MNTSPPSPLEPPATARHGINPFVPTFGTMPPVVSGRADTLGRIAAAYTDGPRTPYRTMILLGPRGSGKTVMLNAARAQAADRGWGVVALSASSSDIVGELMAAARDVPSEAGWGRRPAGFGSPEPRSADPTSVLHARSLTRVLIGLATVALEEGSGVLVAVDELQSMDPTAGRDVAVAVQEVIRNRQLPMVFLGAGLPELEDTLLGDDAITFFGRCLRVRLDAINADEAAHLLTETAATAGGALRPESVAALVAAARGSPYLLQSVGFHSWEAAVDSASGIAEHEAAAGIAGARDDMIAHIVLPVWRRLDTSDRELLALLAERDGAAATGLLHQHLGRWRATASLDRLTRVGVLERGRGEIRFVHDVFCDWIQQQYGSDGEASSGVRALSQKEVAVIALRADDRASYEEISRRTGIDRAYVGRIARQAGLNKGRPRSRSPM